jgi:hypothetical protein
MAIAKEREELLNQLQEALAGIFPVNAEYHRHEDAARNFIVSWRLADAEGGKAKIAREISIRFDEAWLASYEAATGPERTAAIASAWQVINARIKTGYDDGDEMLQGESKAAFLIRIDEWGK